MGAKASQEKGNAMSELASAINAMFVLFIITIVGFVATKCGVLDKTSQERLTKMVFNISLPATLLASVTDLDASSLASQVPLAVGLSVLQFFLLLGIGALSCLILRVPSEQRIPYLFMSICTNTGFIGLPVATSIYGSQAAILSAIFIAIIGFLMYLIGIPMIARGSDTSSTAPAWRQAINPPSIASLIALAIFFTGFQLPAPIASAASMIGSSTAPVAMMIIGIILANAPLRDVVSELRLYPFILIRQLIAPAIVYFVLRLFISDELMLGVFTVMLAMPTGSMASSFMAMFDWDTTLPAAGTILATVASFPIIPALLWVMSL